MSEKIKFTKIDGSIVFFDKDKVEVFIETDGETTVTSNGFIHEVDLFDNLHSIQDVVKSITTH